MFRSVTSQTRRVPDLITGLIHRWNCASLRLKSTVMSFGDGSHGALGLPVSFMGMGSDAYEPTQVPGLPPDISSIAAGHYHSLAVTADGHVWAWGRNSEAQLGRHLLSSRETWNEPKQVQGLEEVKVKAAFASGVISMAIGDDGSLWAWGKSKRGQLGIGEGITEAVLPSHVDTLAGQDIAKVALGWGHGLALTKDGNLFGWGYYADGRLGTMGRTLESSPLDSIAGKFKSLDETSVFEAADKLLTESVDKENEIPIVWSPNPIQELENVQVVDISCGLDHSLVLCRDGTLLSGGSNVYGQLGRRNEDLGMHPVDITFRPRSIASGLGHSLAMVEDDSCSEKANTGDCRRRLVSWGWNCCYQLGRDGKEDVPEIVEGELLYETPVIASGGRAHSMVVSSKKELWSWGSGRNGRLGLGSSVDEREAMLVESLEGFQVMQAVAGFDHSLVLVAD